MRERARFDRELADLLPRDRESSVDNKVKYLALLRHFVEQNGAAVALEPSLMDPGFYDGKDKYKIADQTLQDCIVKAMKGFSESAAVLVDLTQATPAFAGFKHKQQGGIGSIAKIACILAAHQLQFDLRTFSAANASLTSAADVFKKIRQEWFDAQVEGSDSTFTDGIKLKGRVALIDGKRVAMGKDRLPNLEKIFNTTNLSFDFASTGENYAGLDALAQKIHDLGDTRLAGNRAVDVLKQTGFFERMRLMAGGTVNAAATSCIRDVGYMYIASTLIQTGLYDPARGGGLWLGFDYGGKDKRSWYAPKGSGVLHAHAASLAAFFTLLRQGKLVSAAASQAMLDLLDKDLGTHPTTHSPFEDSLESTYGSLVQAWEKLGIAVKKYKKDGVTYKKKEYHDATSFTYGVGGTTLSYVAIGLFSNKKKIMKMIIPLEKCILTRNGVTR